MTVAACSIRWGPGLSPALHACLLRLAGSALAFVARLQRVCWGAVCEDTLCPLGDGSLPTQVFETVADRCSPAPSLCELI